MPLVNVQTPVKPGRLGTAVLPAGLMNKDMIESRARLVAFIGLERRTSQGVWVMYANTKGTMSCTVIRATNVKWSEHQAFKVKREGLVEISEPAETPVGKIASSKVENTASGDFLACDRCGQWRPARDEAQFAELKDKDPLYCEDIAKNVQSDERFACE